MPYCVAPLTSLQVPYGAPERSCKIQQATRRFFGGPCGRAALFLAILCAPAGVAAAPMWDLQLCDCWHALAFWRALWVSKSWIRDPRGASRILCFETFGASQILCFETFGFGILGIESLGFGSRTFASETLGSRIDWFETLALHCWASKPEIQDPVLRPSGSRTQQSETLH